MRLSPANDFLSPPGFMFGGEEPANSQKVTMQGQGAMLLLPPSDDVLYRCRIRYQVLAEDRGKASKILYSNVTPIPDFVHIGYVSLLGTTYHKLVRLEFLEGTLLDVHSDCNIASYNLATVARSLLDAMKAIGDSALVCPQGLELHYQSVPYEQLVYKGHPDVRVVFQCEWYTLQGQDWGNDNCTPKPKPPSRRNPRDFPNNPGDRRFTETEEDREVDPPWGDNDKITPEKEDQGENTAIHFTLTATIFGCLGVETIGLRWVLPGWYPDATLEQNNPIAGCGNLPPGQWEGFRAISGGTQLAYWSYWHYVITGTIARRTSEAPGKYRDP